MSKAKKSPPDNAAQAKLPVERPPKFQGMVATCKKQIATAQKCEEYPTATTVQAAATNLASSVTALEKLLVDLSNAKMLVISLETQRDNQGVVVVRDHLAFETAINTVCQGNAAKVAAWGGNVAARRTALVMSEGPLGAQATAKGLGTVIFRCKRDGGTYGYLFQFGSDPKAPETWPAPTHASGCMYKLTGLPPGQKVYARIALLRRRGGQSPWSSVLEATAR